jgi:hypothetical protein
MELNTLLLRYNLRNTVNSTNKNTTSATGRYATKKNTTLANVKSQIKKPTILLFLDTPETDTNARCFLWRQNNPEVNYSPIPISGVKCF